MILKKTRYSCGSVYIFSPFSGQQAITAAGFNHLQSKTNKEGEGCCKPSVCLGEKIFNLKAAWVFR